jgi:peptidoglycan/xylan/chitin deacetylase (PgdA/CDA1 family)
MSKIAFVFDDGYAKSCCAVAALFERYAVSAVFGVLAEPWGRHPDRGDWSLWRDLAERGHIIHPHGFEHKSLALMTFEDAVVSLERCFEEFLKYLPNFELSQAVFHYPYNAGTDELNAWLIDHVAAVRIGGTGFNTNADLASRVLHCTGFGPDYCDQHLSDQLDQCELDKPNAFIYNLHGVDGEGWGPIHLGALEKALNVILDSPDFSYWNFT